MQELRKEVFEFDDKVYTVKVFETIDGYTVQVFKDDKRATPFSYSVDRLTSMDSQFFSGYSGIDRMIKMAKTDIENGFVFKED
jgi:hypothetical protein